MTINWPVLLGFVFVCVSTIILGGYLGKKSFFGTFVYSSNSMRFILILVASLAIYVVLWLQESYGFIATSIHKVIVCVCFIAAWIIGTLLRKYRVRTDFIKATKLMAPLRKKYYVPRLLFTEDHLQEIATRRSELEEAITHFQSARKLKLLEGRSGKRNAAVALHEIGMVHCLLNNLNDARTSFEAAHSEIQELCSKIGNDHPSFFDDLGLCCLHLGDVEVFSDNPDKAEEWYKRALKLFQQVGNSKNIELVSRLLSKVNMQY